MRPERYPIVLLGASLLALVIPLLVYRQVSFKATLKDTERAVADFRPTTLVLPRTTWQPATVTPLVTAAPASVTTAQPAPSPAQAPPKSAPVDIMSPPTVSFILHGAGNDMAIINGTVLKTGDRYQQWRVERIERNRVLLSGRKGTVWITLQ